MKAVTMLELVLLALSGLGLAGGVVSVRGAEAARWRNSLEAMEVRFPSDIEPKAVTAYITGLAGIVAPRAQRLFTVRAVVVEIVARTSGISFFFLVPPTYKDLVLSALRSAVPGAVVDHASDYRPKPPTFAAELRLSNHRRPLRVENPSAVTAGILSSLQPLDGGEELRIQWILSPVGPVSPVPPPAPQRATSPRLLVPNVTNAVRTREEWRAAQAKRSSALFEGVTRLGVSGADPKRAAQLLNRMSAPFHAANAAGVNLFRRRLSNQSVVVRMTDRRLPFLRFPATFNVEELTALVGIPTGGAEIEGLSLSVSKRRPPSPDLGEAGLVLCRANYPGRERPVAISWRAATEHIGLFGPTGVGKSVLANHVALQAAAAGHGLLLIDPHGDLAADFVAAIPSDRTKDLLWIAPADDVVVGLNVLSGLKTMPELAADLVVNAIRHRWGGVSWGPQLEQLLWAGVVTLTLAGETLVELPRLYADEAYRRQLVAKIDDPFAALPIWARYDSWSEAEQARASGAVLNKTTIFSRPELRALVGQQTSVDFDAVLRDGKIVVVSIPKGRLGRDASMTAAGLVLGSYWMAVLRRSGVPAAERKMSVVVLDEAHELFTLPTSVGLALAESRKYGVAWTLAVQSIGQISTKDGFRHEVLANLRTKVGWMTSATDASALAREFGPGVRPEDLQHLGKREVLVAASVGGRTAPALTGIALPPAPATGSFSDRVAEAQRRHGRNRSDVEEELRRRQDEGRGPGQVRRRRRS